VAKKGRHRRYIEAREFQRSSTFSVENFDLDAPDPFALPETRADDDDLDDDVETDTASADDDKYAELAAKYADLDDSGSVSSSSSDDAGSSQN